MVKTHPGLWRLLLGALEFWMWLQGAGLSPLLLQVGHLAVFDALHSQNEGRITVSPALPDVLPGVLGPDSKADNSVPF